MMRISPIIMSKKSKFNSIVAIIRKNAKRNCYFNIYKKNYSFHVYTPS